jgi:Cellulase (glycosyl hydrolase family 5)
MPPQRFGAPRLVPVHGAPQSSRSNTARTTALISAMTVMFALLIALVPGTTTPADAAARQLSNGCAVSARGIPSCGVLMGGAYKANHDPSPWEKELGGNIGVHRMFFSAGQVNGAVSKAKSSLAKGRLPWISFKLPHSWQQMASGKGDAWAKDIAKRFSALNGPVWIAFAHEPEKDGDILVWKKMQERLGPILRNNASNVGFSVILMGYHQFFGSSTYAMSRIWPNTTVDMAGFDVYDHYGKNGQKKHTDMVSYFDKISSWAKSKGVAWGLAETGISHAGLADRPSWFKDTYAQMSSRGGKAFAYFNTSLNSFQDWTLSTSLKKQKFKETWKSSPTL